MVNKENGFANTSSEAIKSLVSRTVLGNTKKPQNMQSDRVHTNFVRSGFERRVIK